MAAAIERLGMLERPLSPDLFAALIRNIVDQQISVKAAQTVNTRLTLLLGSITPRHRCRCLRRGDSTLWYDHEESGLY